MEIQIVHLEISIQTKDDGGRGTKEAQHIENQSQNYLIYDYDKCKQINYSNLTQGNPLF